MMASSRPPPNNPSGIRLPPFLNPAEIAFVGQVVSKVAQSGVIIDKVGRIAREHPSRNGGLRFFSHYGEKHFSHDMILSSADSDVWAYKLPSGTPVNSDDFAGTIKKHYLGRT
jgi:hypothetical protein